MKIAVIKLGSRIAYGGKDTSGGNGEAKSIIKMLDKAGADLHIYTKILKKDKNPDHLTFWDIRDEHKNINDRGYEALIVLNGNVNFFGGAEDEAQILNYSLINNYQGRVYYIYCDPSLQLTQIWPSVSKKPWASNWNQKDIEITREDIIYVSQPYNLAEVKKIQDKIGIKVEKTVHYPFERFPCLNEKIEMNPNPTVDLSYGGTMRGNRRIKKMVQFYFGYSEDVNVEMFGKIKEPDLIATRDKHFSSNMRPPTFGPAVNYDDFMVKMNDTISHVVIGDKWYEGNDMAQRCFESIWSNVVTFIDEDMDPQRRVFPDGPCAKFNYVKNHKDVEKRIKILKERPEIRRQILEAQIETINFKPLEYCKGFLEILKEDSTGKIGEQSADDKPQQEVVASPLF